MDDEAVAMRHELDQTLANLTHKLGELETQVVGTVRTVKDSVNTVRNNFDLKFQLRRRPWAFVTGAAALGFLGGFSSSRGRSESNRRFNTRVALPVVPATAPSYSDLAWNDVAKSAKSPSNWLAKFVDTFEPEVAEFKGIVIGTLLGVAREIVVSEVCRSSARQAPYADNNSRCTATIQLGDGEPLDSLPKAGER